MNETAGRQSKSGLYSTNTFALATLKACEDNLGLSGLNALLEHAHLEHLIGQFPPKNRNKEFDFADYTALMSAIDETYGPRDARIMKLRIGKSSFLDLLAIYGSMVGAVDLAFKLLPFPLRLRLGVNAMAKIFNRFSDVKTLVVEHNDDFDYVIEQCPMCWGHSGATSPVCFSQVGLLKGGLAWLSDGKEFDVKEIHCKAMGDSTCTFRIHKKPLD